MKGMHVRHRHDPPLGQTARAALLAVLAAWAACLAQPPAARAQEAAPPPASVFAMPEAARATWAASASIRAGDYTAAATILDSLIARHPGLAGPHTSRAALSMLEGDPEAALAHLAQAARLDGSALTSAADNPLLAPLAEDPELGPRFRALLEAPAPEPRPEPQPAMAADGQAPVTAQNTGWNPQTARLESAFAFPPGTEAPVLPPKPETAAYDILREHAGQGRAAGNHGDLYDNRDRQHSALRPKAHPQLTHIVYGEAAREAGLDYGLAGAFSFNRPTLGNSSTAITSGAFWRSLPRQAMTRPDGTGPMRLWQEVSSNQLYVYPAHKDLTQNRGDLFPANTPYILVSRGSSGSDKPFLRAVAMILAAFRPETKERLIEENLIVPAIQMVFRRSLQHVRSRESYFSGEAHPAVFEGHQINLARMVSLANAIKPEDIPAEVRIRVEEEELGEEGVDFFGRGLSEQLFDTPGAVARIWRAKTGRRTMIVDAGGSRDANGNLLTFHWHLLQGEAEKVRIEPLEDGRKARITLDWHEPFAISEDNPLLTSRVDIGVFAHNGTHDSAPAILSWYFPAHQTRIYEPGPDGTPRILSIDHADPAKARTYADPQLFPRAGWRDEFAYAEDGSPAGWTRHRGEEQDEFTAEGAHILARNPDGTPAGTRAIRHELRPAPDGRLTIVEMPR